MTGRLRAALPVALAEHHLEASTRTPSTADQIWATTTATLAAAGELCPAHVVDRAAGWLAGGDRYQLHPSETTPRTHGGAGDEGGRTHRVAVRRVAPDPDAVENQYLTESTGRLAWRAGLVSNREFAAFLDDLAALADVHNVVDGVHLLAVTSMPRERGGCLHPRGSDLAHRGPRPGHEPGSTEPQMING